MKVKLNGATIKDFFLHNGEKLALGVVGLIVLLMAWGGISGALENTKQVKAPSEFKTAATSAQQNIASEESYRAPPLPPIDVEKVIGKDDFDPQLVATSTPWDPPLNPKEAKRDLPKLLPAQQLITTAVVGAVAMKAATAPATPLAPPAGPGAAAGAPAGAQARVTRDERKSGYSGEGIPQPMTVVVIKGIVPLERQRAEFATALPKEAGGVNPMKSDDPMYVKAEIQRAEVGPNGLGPWTDLPAVDPTQFASTAMGDPVLPAFTSMGTAMAPPPLYYRPWRLGEVSHPEIPLTARPVASASVNSAVPSVSTEQVALFRHFDLTAQPGKTYRYRTRLVLHNPNFQVEPRYLAKADLAKDEYLTTDWSEPTADVAVRGVMTDVLAEKISLQRNDPQVKLTTLVLEPGSSKLVRGEEVFALGDVVDFKAKASSVEPQGGPQADVASYDFKTGQIVVDLRGGDIPSQLGEPSESLLSDSQGALHLADQSRDQRTMALYSGTITAPTATVKAPPKKDDDKGLLNRNRGGAQQTRPPARPLPRQTR